MDLGCVQNTSRVDEGRETERPPPNKDGCSSSASLGLRLREKEWVGVGKNGGLWMCLCVRIWTVPQMG